MLLLVLTFSSPLFPRQLDLDLVCQLIACLGCPLLYGLPLWSLLLLLTVLNSPHYKQLIPATEPYQLHLSSSQGPHQLPEPGDVRRQTVVARNGKPMTSLLSLWTPEWRELIALIISIFSMLPLGDKSPIAERSYCGVTYNPCTKLFLHLWKYYCTYSSAPVITLNMVHRCYLRYLSFCAHYMQNQFQTQLQYKER